MNAVSPHAGLTASCPNTLTSAGARSERASSVGCDREQAKAEAHALFDRMTAEADEADPGDGGTTMFHVMHASDVLAAVLAAKATFADTLVARMRGGRS